MAIALPVSRNTHVVPAVEPDGVTASPGDGQFVALPSLLPLSGDWLSAPLSRPMADLVANTLATGQWSDNTMRAYRTAIGWFLRFLDDERGTLLPARVAATWRPFAVSTR